MFVFQTLLICSQLNPWTKNPRVWRCFTNSRPEQADKQHAAQAGTLTAALLPTKTDVVHKKHWKPLNSESLHLSVSPREWETAPGPDHTCLKTVGAAVCFTAISWTVR